MVRILPKPKQSPKAVYLTCISKVKKPALKASLTSVADTIDTDATDYDDKAERALLYLIAESDDVDGVVTQEQMEKVYTGRMAAKKAPGREIYDKLKAAAPHGVCPFCAQRSVKTLDHYLPKAEFPSLVVVPFNLIPSCSDCNKVKSSKVADSADKQILHPYYDDVTAHQWLIAAVNETTPAAFSFDVMNVQAFDQMLNSRIEHHFDLLELAELYSSKAGVLLEDIRYRLEELYRVGGKVEVHNYLAEEQSSRRRNNINSWQTATYQAMAESDWFCDGGFRGI
ncbi:possible EA31 gene protein, phage lambda [marine gamma proteobacterium HTCC2143]|uniref:Possible EA31 gene protein, phage lambda n=1 Tax=marine gamma proteobacterium HTCC2143 TaxID=247633 RepID=A0YFV2_9GAMM|nr:possible EA31 gene protein, phage lambda [marine gamma proteobacterium HTCC2143]